MKNFLRTFVLGILAGISIGLGGTLFLICKSNILPILGSFLFSIGLLLVCSLGLNLYTGKVGYLLRNNKETNFNLLPIYLGNIVGSIGYGYLFRLVTSSEILLSTGDAVSLSKLIDLGDGGKTWYSLLFGGMLCGVLVYLAVDSFKKENLHPVIKLTILVMCVGCFVAAGFEHCIADMFYFAFSNAFGTDFLRSLLTLLIITIGNSIGSILFDLALKGLKKE